MKTKELSIIVLGKTAHGKSTMLYQLEKLLKENGYTVTVDENSLLDYKNIDDFHQKMMRDEEIRLISLKENTIIRLKEVQVARDNFSL